MRSDHRRWGLERHLIFRFRSMSSLSRQVLGELTDCKERTYVGMRCSGNGWPWISEIAIRKRQQLSFGFLCPDPLHCSVDVLGPTPCFPSRYVMLKNVRFPRRSPQLFSCLNLFTNRVRLCMGVPVVVPSFICVPLLRHPRNDILHPGIRLLPTNYQP